MRGSAVQVCPLLPSLGRPRPSRADLWFLRSMSRVFSDSSLRHAGRWSGCVTGRRLRQARYRRGPGVWLESLAGSLRPFTIEMHRFELRHSHLYGNFFRASRVYMNGQDARQRTQSSLRLPLVIGRCSVQGRRPVFCALFLCILPVFASSWCGIDPFLVCKCSVFPA